MVAVAVAALGLLAVIGSGAAIRAAAKGKTFSSVSAIPHRPIGLLLGCSQYLSDGRTNLFFAHRVAAAAQLIKARKVDYLIVSGDNHTVGYDESTAMKAALVAEGVPTNKIYCDFAGFRTLDSIVRAKAVFGQPSITVISQEFHNQRAIYIARHAGIDAIGFNAREVDAYNSFKTMVREQFARIRTVLDVCLLGARPKFLGPHIEIGRDHP